MFRSLRQQVVTTEDLSEAYHGLVVAIGDQEQPVTDLLNRESARQVARRARAVSWMLPAAAPACALVLGFALTMCWISALIGLLAGTAQGMQIFGSRRCFLSS